MNRINIDSIYKKANNTTNNQQENGNLKPKAAARSGKSEEVRQGKEPLKLELPHYKISFVTHDGLHRTSVQVQLPSGIKEGDIFFKIIENGSALEILINDHDGMQMAIAQQGILRQYVPMPMSDIWMTTFSRTIEDIVQKHGFDNRRIRRKMVIELDYQVEEEPYYDGVIPKFFSPKIGELKMFFIQLIRKREDYNRDIKKPKINDVYIPGL